MTTAAPGHSHDDDDSNNSNTATAWNQRSKDYGNFALFTKKFADSAVAQAVEAWEQKQPQPRKEEEESVVRCLDIAAGTGAATWSLLETLCRNQPDRCVSITATDQSPEMLEQLRQQLPAALAPHPHASISTHVADMQTLEGIPDASVDICTMVFGIMFPPDTVAALRQVKRVLRPNGGVAVITSWTWNSMKQDLNTFVYEQGKIADLHDFTLPLQPGTDREYFLRLAAQKTGMKQISVSYISHDKFPMNIASTAQTSAANPLLQKYLPLDAAAMEQFLRSFGDGADERGPFRFVAGTALCLRIGF